jgi:7-carboxy-7-deazaguanine synthase
VKRFPVAEIFGPTIQGEGALQGIPAYFLRFGGCDYRCEWCDSPHAVLPHAVRANQRMSADDICDTLRGLPLGPRWIVITGGNPVLHDLSDVLSGLHDMGYRIAIETQGSKYKPWLESCESICVSPKPPSAGLTMSVVEANLDRFCDRFDTHDPRVFFKIVVFDQGDYEWARSVHHRFKWIQMFLSAGNDAGRTVANPDRVDERTLEQIQRDLLSRARWLTNRTMVDPGMQNARVQTQQHVLLWGNERGH